MNWATASNTIIQNKEDDRVNELHNIVQLMREEIGELKNKLKEKQANEIIEEHRKIQT